MPLHLFFFSLKKRLFDFSFSYSSCNERVDFDQTHIYRIRSHALADHVNALTTLSWPPLFFFYIVIVFSLLHLCTNFFFFFGSVFGWRPIKFNIDQRYNVKLLVSLQSKYTINLFKKKRSSELIKAIRNNKVEYLKKQIEKFKLK